MKAALKGVRSRATGGRASLSAHVTDRNACTTTITNVTIPTGNLNQCSTKMQAGMNTAVFIVLLIWPVLQVPVTRYITLLKTIRDRNTCAIGR